MGSFTDDDLNEIRARIDLADLVEEHGVPVRRVGHTAKACCPFHKEKTPSFNIRTDRGFYKCFGCGEHGDIFTFTQKMEGITFPEAVKKLAERAGVVLHTRHDPQAKARQRLYAINAELAAFYRRCLLQTQDAEAARRYLDSRALGNDVQERFGIGYAPNRRGALLTWAAHHGYSPEEMVAAGVLAPPRPGRSDYYDRFAGRITFPICDPQGRVIAFSSRLIEDRAKAPKYVNSPETEIFRKSQTLYAFHLARAAIARQLPRRAIVCEGQIDVIRCHACGFETALASQGTAFTADHVRLLKRAADTAVLVFDGDSAGTKAALRTAGLFLSDAIPVRIATLPQGEDPDSLLRNQGPEAFRACLDAAEDPAPYLIRRLRESEAAPDSLEAVTRIASAAVSLIRDCEDPILTAKFLQEAAGALGLPLSALETSLTRAREAADEARQRRETYQTRQQGPGMPASPEDAPSPARYIASDDGVAFWEGPADDFIPETDDSIPDNGDTVSPVSVAGLMASRALNEAFGELLVHHFSDSAVMDSLIRHLPQRFVDDPLIARLYALACTAYLKHLPAIEILDGDPVLTEMLSTLVARPDRMLGDDDDTLLAGTRDLIRRYWVRECRNRQHCCSPDSAEAIDLALSGKRLETLPWEQAAPYMDAVRAFPEDGLRIRPSTPSETKKPDVPAAPVPPSDVHLAKPLPQEPPEPDAETDFYALF